MNSVRTRDAQWQWAQTSLKNLMSEQTQILDKERHEKEQNDVF